MTIIMSNSGGGSSNSSSSSSGSSTSKPPDHTMKAHGRVEVKLHSFVHSARLLSPSPLILNRTLGVGVWPDRWGEASGRAAEGRRHQSVAK